MAAAIELNGVMKSFGGVRVLDRIDLAIPEGETTVLIGPSGAGKTVTVNHIVGLLHPDRGEVIVEGKNLARISEAELFELRRNMSAVLQGSLPFTCGLFYSINVFENVAFALRDRKRLPEEEVRRVTMQNLALVGLAEFAEAMPDHLSAGMSKRVALARAFALEAGIVIIDDFDSGIDGVRLALLCEMIRDYRADTGATVLVTTHDMRAARRLGDRLAVIYEGRIVAQGDAETVLASDDPVVRQLTTGSTRGPIELASS